MTPRESLYKRNRFPSAIIQHAVWLYYRFNLSHRDIEDILVRRGVLVTHESNRLWYNKFGPLFARLRSEPRTVVTDKLASYAVARRELLPTAAHDTRRYAINRAELSRQATRI